MLISAKSCVCVCVCVCVCASVCVCLYMFLKHYAASARTVTEASHKTFNEFGLKLLDVQLIHFTCADPATQTLLDKDIMSVQQLKQTKNRAQKKQIALRPCF